MLAKKATEKLLFAEIFIVLLCYRVVIFIGFADQGDLKFKF